MKSMRSAKSSTAASKIRNWTSARSKDPATWKAIAAAQIATSTSGSALLRGFSPRAGAAVQAAQRAAPRTRRSLRPPRDSAARGESPRARTPRAQRTAPAGERGWSELVAGDGGEREAEEQFVGMPCRRGDTGQKARPPEHLQHRHRQHQRRVQRSRGKEEPVGRDAPARRGMRPPVPALVRLASAHAASCRSRRAQTEGRHASNPQTPRCGCCPR